MSARYFAIPAMALLVSGCISMAPEAQVSPQVEAMPQAFDMAEVEGDYRPAAWWSHFEDPVLDALVDRALDANLDIAQAAARAERAAAQARVSRAGLLPALEATAGASYSDTPLSGGAFSNFPGAPTRLSNETYSLGLGASYELDLFGRVRNDYAAARSDALAAEQDFRATRLATAAETISAYFDVVDARYQIANSLQSLDVLSDRVARTDERYRRGLAQSFELYQVRQELRGLEASLPQRETALAAAEGRLALLLADYPQGVDALLSEPLQPRLTFDPVPMGLPVELLAQRPDVAASWERLEAARLRIGARRAERFPALRLSASTGTQGGAVDDVLDLGQNWLLQLAANVTAPIFDGGRISANIRAARATYDEAAAAYGQSVLNAWREVDLAATDYEEQRQRYRLIAAQLAEVQANADLQAERYRAGVADYTAYLDALRALYQVESSLSSAGRDVALARLGLHRALGGDWDNEGNTP
ncbi:efflux transporter outer membrane subunit [Alteraurantiacibacter aquimixticola]|uniref:TolC family protein n=1 Tax=Alteraurantiacibacter aquimixticola TaxID=2489173 RepID=A0A4T3F3D8_9SPHN|nr:TolC family protein [Alteraurantiacibacter aquimixticola]TIX50670.1 TolC family protein [Alteraurantiacibacter aquimixticola]